jgi:signal transduction histidine kinase
MKFSDTGVGIRKEDMEKIFEPFLTTKPEEKGTGLGLSVSYSIIEKHGGILEVESALGIGTAVIIDLPIRK